MGSSVPLNRILHCGSEPVCQRGNYGTPSSPLVEEVDKLRGLGLSEVCREGEDMLILNSGNLSYY